MAVCRALGAYSDQSALQGQLEFSPGPLLAVELPDCSLGAASISGHLDGSQALLVT